MKKTYIISAFPACGKSYCFKNHQNIFTILDSDSSEFSWIKDSEGNNTKERNLEFPNNYIKYINDNIGKVDIVFVSSHDVVRKALYENNIETTIVYPEKHMKEVFLQRYQERGNNEGFISFISNNWDNFISDIELESYGFNKISLNHNQPYITIELLKYIMV